MGLDIGSIVLDEFILINAGGMEASQKCCGFLHDNIDNPTAYEI